MRWFMEKASNSFLSFLLFRVMVADWVSRIEDCVCFLMD